MQLSPLAEEVIVIIFMEGLRTGVSMTEAYHVHPSTFKEDVDVAFNTVRNTKMRALLCLWVSATL